MRGGARIFILPLLVLPLLGLSCSTAKLGEQLQAAREKAFNVWGRPGANFAQNLSEAQKQAVADWLKSNQLNDYGDAGNTVYTGGTPLFNEATGETKNRFEYLLEKFPALKEVIKSEISKQVKIEDKK